MAGGSIGLHEILEVAKELHLAFAHAFLASSGESKAGCTYCIPSGLPWTRLCSNIEIYVYSNIVV